jgi:hypothetical protein
MENNTPNLSPELADILNRIKAFNVTNPDAIFIFGFIGWKESDEECEECGGHCSCVDEDKVMLGGHGDLDTLRQLSNDLRNGIEDNCNKQGFVSF